MHPLTFSMKRCFLRSVAINREYTKQHHLTPARFDMLVAIARGVDGVLQRRVRGQLAVRSPTVSRMLSSLEELGYLRRHVYPLDRRHRWITLTPKGKQVIDAAQDDLTFGPFGEAVGRAIVSRQPEAREPTEKALAEARALFRTIRELTSDTAWLCYPTYLRSGERSPDFPVPYPGDSPAWMAPPDGASGG